MRLVSRSLFMIFVVGIWHAELQGQVYVDQICGSNVTGTGSQAAPYQTIDNALAQNPGVAEVVVLPSGSSPYPALIVGPANDGVVIRAARGPAVTVIEAITVSLNVSCTLQGLTVSNATTNSQAGNGIILQGDTQLSTSVVLKNLVVSGCARAGIRVLHAGGTNSASYSYYEISNCTVVENALYGVELIEDGGGFDQLPPGIIENCLFAGNDVTGLWADTTLTGASLTRVYCRFCAFADSLVTSQGLHWSNSPHLIMTLQYVMTTTPWGPGGWDAVNPCFTTDGTYQLDCVAGVCPEWSCLRDLGNPAQAFADPDGTRNDLGAFGGPGSVGFHFSPSSQGCGVGPGGPTITAIRVLPCGPGGQVQIVIDVQ